jgi:hypothetical protein
VAASGSTRVASMAAWRRSDGRRRGGINGALALAAARPAARGKISGASFAKAKEGIHGLPRSFQMKAHVVPPPL